MSKVVAKRTPGPQPKTQKILAVIREHPEGLKWFQILKYADVERGSLSGMLSNLKDRGLVIREGARFDGTYYPVVL